jgi:hypothetical protein|tara:strand:+ start:784 stop:1512 length:729 start_codon:yes stop_codon:yes gene_type:complete
MSQLIKHFLVDRDTGEWIKGKIRGYVYPKLKELEIVHSIFDENNNHICLSKVPEYFEYSKTVTPSVLTEYQNDSNITIVSSTEKQVEEPVINEETGEPTGETTTVTLHDVTYREAYTIVENDGLKILTQEEWNTEISNYDARQTEKRYKEIRIVRDKVLKDTDWMVIKSIESGTNLSNEYKNWRTTLRDLPSVGITTDIFPATPGSIKVDVNITKDYSEKLRSIELINDTLPALPEDDLDME